METVRVDNDMERVKNDIDMQKRELESLFKRDQQFVRAMIY